MRTWVLVGSMIVAWMAAASATAQPPAADSTIYTVAYVEVAPASAGAAATILAEYRDTSRPETGFVSLDLFEQIDRPGHFVFTEAWKDQPSLAAHATAASTKRLVERLQPLRVSPLDQRPYKTLSVAAATGRPTGQAVYVVSHVDTIPAPGSDGPGLLRRAAEESRKDDGNLRFDVVQHTMRANHFTVIEGWRDQRALDAHVSAAHTKQYRETLAPLTGSPLDERTLRAIP